MKAFGLLVLSLVALFYVSSMGGLRAEPLRNGELVEFSNSQQLDWIRGVFDAYGHLAYQSDPDQARCIWGWLDHHSEIRTAFLMEHFEKNPDQVPSSAILVLLKVDCQFRV